MKIFVECRHLLILDGIFRKGATTTLLFCSETPRNNQTPFLLLKLFCELTLSNLFQTVAAFGHLDTRETLQQTTVEDIEHNLSYC